MQKTVLFNSKEAHDHSFSYKVCIACYAFKHNSKSTTLLVLDRHSTGDGRLILTISYHAAGLTLESCRAQFARRDAIYYNSNTVRLQDAILIICSITSTPTVPLVLPVIARQVVPKELLDVVGGLLDE